MSPRRSARHQSTVNRILTNVGLVLGEHFHRVVIERLANKLFGDLASAEMTKLLSHIDSGTLADNENVGKEPFEL